MALIYNATFDSQTRILSLLDKAGNVISSCEVPSKELVDDPNKPLMLRAIEDNSSVTLTKNGTLSNTYQTSTDGTNWTDYTLGTQISLNKGESVYFRCSAHPTTQTDSNYVQFVMTGEIEAWHNAYSMIRQSFTNTGNSVGVYGMYALFRACKSLTKVPLLLNALTSNCYSSMFRDCTSLVQSPELPATNLEFYCYSSMFNGCTSLVNAPVLPATTIAQGCYYSMFRGCTSLTSAPQLPATNRAPGCYGYMFYGCTSLTSAPQLPATTLATNCYDSMFYGCSKLKEVRISATTKDYNSLYYWLSGVSATGDFYCDPNATIFPTDSASGIPKGWNRRNINLLNDLTLTATADNSSVKLTKNGTLDNTFEVDTGNGWTAYEFDTVIPLNAGQSCKWRCSAHPTTQSYSNYVKFVMTGTIEASGNVNSMILGGFENLTSLSGYDYAFYQLFSGCSSLTKAPNLPATTLAGSCYHSMFSGCSSLTKAPNLPATTLAAYCYHSMFSGCSSLTQAPDLPVTTLADFCYNSMFNGCSSLTQAPQLPATTLARNCYGGLFYGCRALTKAPNLPATTLAGSCYQAMFYGCTSLTSAPQLPATTLVKDCYSSMFKGCTSLTSAPQLPATTLAPYCCSNMFGGCTSLTQAPSLPVTTVAKFCYSAMFNGCTSLTSAPQLPATTLADSCYRQMFKDCTALKEVRISATTTATDALNGWLDNVSATGDFYCDPNATIFPTDSASGIPKGWRRVDVDDPKKPLMLRAIEDNSSVYLSKYGTLSNTYQTSTDGTNWTDYTLGTQISLNKGESVYFRCSNHPTTQSNSNYVRFIMGGKIEAWHNAYSMISSSFTDTSASVGSYGMFILFSYCEALTKAPLLLNALAEHCYDGLFYDCIALKQAPSLPATTLVDSCYYDMFNRCQSLKEVRIAATKTAKDALFRWLNGVSATGDFYCDPNATIFPSGESGIPANWNRHALSDYPVNP